MAIEDYGSRHVRKRVVCIDDKPSDSDKQWFPELLIEQCDRARLTQYEFLSTCTAVVFFQSSKKQLRVIRDLESYAKLLLDCGCRIVVRSTKSGRDLVLNRISSLELPPSVINPDQRKWGEVSHEGITPSPHIYIFNYTAGWPDILREIAAHPALDFINCDLEIDAKNEKGLDASLDESEKLLLKRAFRDYEKLHLVRFGEGLSGDPVYRAYAERTRLAMGHTGRWPLTYFVKLGDRSTIYREHKIYEDNVRPHIPFHLGPRLSSDHCCLGACKGVITGDYVQESESLRDSASSGRAASAIACLFDRTLHGWYRDVKEDSQPITKKLLEFFPEDIPPGRKKRAEELDCSSFHLEDLRALFSERCALAPIWIGPIHGDLHPGNVLVRGTDAIVIDFLKYRPDMPPVYDAASLEAGLLVDGFGDDKRLGSDWIESVMPLYDTSPFHKAKLYKHPKDPSYWFYECVRRIRFYGFQMERKKGQYAAALAVALLHKGAKDIQLNEPQASHRAGALVLAKRILLGIEATP